MAEVALFALLGVTVGAIALTLAIDLATSGLRALARAVRSRLST